MSKTYLRAANVALALGRDAWGNNLTGNDVRAMRYLQLSVKVLEALTETIESKGDVRKTKALEAVLSGVTPELDDMDKVVPFSHDRAEERTAYFRAQGLKGSALKTIDPALLEKLGAKAPEGGGTVTMKLSGKDAERFLRGVAGH